MGQKSGIGWTDDTDNIIRVKGGGWWCRVCSPGCENCYAAAMNIAGLHGGNGLEYKGQPPEGLFLVEELLEAWPKQSRPRRHFVASMTDIFGEWVPEEWITRFLDVMLMSPRQTFQMLTKRHERAHSAIHTWLERRGMESLPWHMQIGFSIENQKYLEKRIGYLVEIPAAVRWISAEPLLGPLQFRRADLERIQWIVTGGESGPNCRPAEVSWFHSLRNQCEAHGVPFFMKQLGGYPKKRDGLADFPEDLRVQEFPKLLDPPDTQEELFPD